MSIHEKMQSDYLWVRHAPVEEGVKVRNHGFNYLYDRAPNSVERLESIYRSIGKQYDWDLEKFRLGKKGIDRGNKKRFLKNALRFVKNPIGYTFWKTYRFFQASPKVILIGLCLTWFFNLIEYKQYSLAVQRMDQILLQHGKNVEGSQGRMKGYQKTTLPRSPNVFDYLLKAPLTSDQIIINPTWKQNIRKELQLTNLHNVVF